MATSNNDAVYAIPRTGPVVFIGMGQSNELGAGQVAEFPPSNRLTVVDATPSLGRRGPVWWAVSQFADMHPSNQVILVQCGQSGTAIAEFMPGGTIYGRCMEAVRQTQAPVIGVFFYQGETDAGYSLTGSWNGKFQTLIASLRRDSGNDKLPVVWAQIGKIITPPNTAASLEQWRVFRDMQATVSLPQPSEMILTVDQVPEDHDEHLGEMGSMVVGDRFYCSHSRLTVRS